MLSLASRCIIQTVATAKGLIYFFTWVCIIGSVLMGALLAMYLVSDSLRWMNGDKFPRHTIVLFANYEFGFGVMFGVAIGVFAWHVAVKHFSVNL